MLTRRTYILIILFSFISIHTKCQKICLNELIDKFICNGYSEEIVSTAYLLEKEITPHIKLCSNTPSCIKTISIKEGDFLNLLKKDKKLDIILLSEEIVDSNLIWIRFNYGKVDLQGYKDKLYQLLDYGKMLIELKKDTFEILKRKHLIYFDLHELKKIDYLEIGKEKFFPKRKNDTLKVKVHSLPINFEIKFKKGIIKGRINKTKSYCDKKQIKVSFGKIYKNKFHFFEENCSDKGYIYEGVIIKK